MLCLPPPKVPVIDQIDSILVPKVESAAEVAFVSSFLDLNCGVRARHVKFLACIESARGLVELRSVCKDTPKLSALIVRPTQGTAPSLSDPDWQ